MSAKSPTSSPQKSSSSRELISPAVSEANEAALKELAKTPDNCRCADCRKDVTSWVSITLGAFLCEDCAAIHKRCLKNISEVKCISLGLFTLWDSQTISFLKKNGNKVVNRKWEWKTPDSLTLPSPSANKDEKEVFVRSKYERMEFCEPMAGNLAVKIGKGSTKKRWCAIADPYLHIYKEQKNTSPVETLNLTSCTVEKVEMPSPAKEKEKDKSFKFRLVTGSTTKVTSEFTCSSAEEVNEWISALKATTARISFGLFTVNIQDKVSPLALRRTASAVPTLPQKKDTAEYLSSVSLNELLEKKIAGDEEATSNKLKLEDELKFIEQSLQEAQLARSELESKIKVIDETLSNLSDRRFQLESRLENIQKEELISSSNTSLQHAKNAASSLNSQGHDLEKTIEKEGILIAASLQKLIEILAAPETQEKDPDFLPVFLTTYRSFTTPIILFEELVKRYRNNIGSDDKKRTAQANRVLSIFKNWISSHFYDFKSNNELLRNLIVFLEENLKNGPLSPRDARSPSSSSSDNSISGSSSGPVGILANSSERSTSSSSITASLSSPSISTSGVIIISVTINELSSILKRKILGFDSSVEGLRGSNILTSGRSQESIFGLQSPHSILPKNLQKFSLEDIDPLELARQLTLLEFDIFKAIEPREFLNQSWTHKTKKSILAPGIIALSKRSNDVSKWVMTQIVSVEDVPGRVRVLEKFIDVTKHLRELKNFNGVMEMISALNTAPIGRLKKTWAAMKPKYTTQYEELLEFMSPCQNNVNYRKEQKASAPPSIPNMPVYLHDLTSLEEGTPNVFQDYLINFAKRKKIAAIIQLVREYQIIPYNMKPVDSIVHWLNDARIMTETEAFTASAELEPSLALSSMNFIGSDS